MQRVAILANEKQHGIRLMVRKNNLILQANNTEQEEAREELAIEYGGYDITVGFNVNYFLDVLNILPDKTFSFSFSDKESVLISKEDMTFVIMPMQI